jgi:hypothetical protein
MDCLKGNISLQYVTFADVDKELLISTYQCQKLKKSTPVNDVNENEGMER